MYRLITLVLITLFTSFLKGQNLSSPISNSETEISNYYVKFYGEYIASKLYTQNSKSPLRLEFGRKIKSNKTYLKLGIDFLPKNSRINESFLLEGNNQVIRLPTLQEEWQLNPYIGLERVTIKKKNQKVIIGLALKYYRSQLARYSLASDTMIIALNEPFEFQPIFNIRKIGESQKTTNWGLGTALNVEYGLPMSNDLFVNFGILLDLAIFTKEERIEPNTESRIFIPGDFRANFTLSITKQFY